MSSTPQPASIIPQTAPNPQNIPTQAPIFAGLPPNGLVHCKEDLPFFYDSQEFRLHRAYQMCLCALIYATDGPTTEELEASATQSTKDDADENPLVVPSSTIAAATLAHLSTSPTCVSSTFPLANPSPSSSSFSSNEIFENGVLKKNYVYRKDVGYGGDFVYGRAIGTDKVKDEKDLTMEFENETSIQIARKSTPNRSFFNSPPDELRPERPARHHGRTCQTPAQSWSSTREIWVGKS
ncbi:hypothetical protein DFH94DRAFT_810403 [Russula ochroleuca]|uniref:Uncharacterized protein n=1 Tax=Russula ochroleuca TaxID=152965 RepID=A0A9P5K072_9AGAM|nr:hypothetical protein DFH94DRAFT_810403 [Russula ochroleuca]